MGHYCVATSACGANGAGGCAIAVSTKHSFTERADVGGSVSIDNLSILWADPRRLIIRVSAASIQLYIISAHGLDASYLADASDRDAGECPVRDWWKATTDIVQKISPFWQQCHHVFSMGSARISEYVANVTGSVLDPCPRYGVDGRYDHRLCSIQQDAHCQYT